MTLDETNAPNEVIGRFEELARSEAISGDGRAMRLFRRLMDASGYGKGGRDAG